MAILNHTDLIGMEMLVEYWFYSFVRYTVRSSHQRCSVRKGVLRNFAKFTGKACNFIKKETLAQVFPCEFCEISKNTFFTEHGQEHITSLKRDRLLISEEGS